MQRQSFLSDLLSTLWDRNRPALADADKRDISGLCRALISAEGEVSGYKLAGTILEKYRSLTDDQKAVFFGYLNDKLDIDAAEVARLATEYDLSRSPDTFVALQAAVEPDRQELFRRLNQPPEATAELVALRVDLLKLLRKHPHLKRIDHDLVHLLRSWFNRGFLVMRQINWDTPAAILEKIVAYEAVHEITDWDDLRRRIHPPDRRCFAFFHPAMPGEPLIFVEVALTPAIPGSIDALLSDTRAHQEPQKATTAVFYSISNCQAGLTGVSFGNLLIKQVAEELAKELPQLKEFVTLSPIPGLNRWLREQPASDRIARTLDGSATREEMAEVAAHFLLNVKRDDGMPVDPVSRFHLGNGALVHAVHAGADRSAKGMAQSSGVMVTYRYDLRLTERNHEAFANRKTVTATRAMQSLAKAGQDALNGD